MSYIEKKHYACECNGELITLSKDWTDDWPQLYLSIYSYGKHKNDRVRFLDRFRWILHFIKTGEPYLDCVILNTETAKELGTDIIKLAKEVEKRWEEEHKDSVKDNFKRMGYVEGGENDSKI